MVAGVRPANIKTENVVADAERVAVLWLSVNNRTVRRHALAAVDTTADNVLETGRL